MNLVVSLHVPHFDVSEILHEVLIITFSDLIQVHNAPCGCILNIKVSPALNCWTIYRLGHSRDFICLFLRLPATLLTLAFFKL